MPSARSGPVVRVTSPSFSKSALLRSELSRSFPASAFNEAGERFTRSSLKAFLKDAEAAVIGLEPVDADLLRSCRRLKAIAKYGVGLDNVDQKACRRRRVRVFASFGVNRLSVAELALGSMLSLCRNSFRTAMDLKGGRWNKDGGFELSGKTVGIIGVGHVGKELIRLLRPFRCRLLVNDLVDQAAYYRAQGCVETSKDRIFRDADLVTLHVPLTLRTRHLVNRAALAKMKASAFVVNTARGPIVDQAALKRALTAGTIAGAALDVYEDEPPTDRDFLALPNLLCTPHIGGNSREAVTAMGLSAVTHLRDFFKGSRHNKMMNLEDQP